MKKEERAKLLLDIIEFYEGNKELNKLCDYMVARNKIKEMVK